jgi:methylated-DNA-protein-cysteine methyltransferase-like protein
VVRRIPAGRVATYGVVARLAGRPGAARTVGWALSALPVDADVPWWRVINAAGQISLTNHAHGGVLQRALLLRERVEFGPNRGVNLGKVGWPGGAYDSVTAAQTRATGSRKRHRPKRLRG